MLLYTRNKIINSDLSKICDVIYIGDLEHLNATYAIMEASSKHPCIYCDAEAQDLQSETAKTIGSLLMEYHALVSKGGDKNERALQRCKEHSIWSRLRKSVVDFSSMNI